VVRLAGPAPPSQPRWTRINKEFALLRALAAESTRVLSKQELLRDVWGFRSMGASRRGPMICPSRVHANGERRTTTSETRNNRSLCRTNATSSWFAAEARMARAAAGQCGSHPFQRRMSAITAGTISARMTRAIGAQMSRPPESRRRRRSPGASLGSAGSSRARASPSRSRRRGLP
jgi:hypothetical protein